MITVTYDRGKQKGRQFYPLEISRLIVARKLKYSNCMTSQPTSHAKSAKDFDLVKTVALVTFPYYFRISEKMKIQVTFLSRGFV